MTPDIEKPIDTLATDTRKDPVPPALHGSFADPAIPSDRVEPTLGPLGPSAEPKVAPLAVPDDLLRRGERRGGARTSLAVAALTALCVCVGGYIAWSYVANTPWNASSPAADSAPIAPPQPTPGMVRHPIAAIPAPSALAPPARQTASAPQAAPTPNQHAARDAADRARREAAARARKAQLEQARRAAAMQARKAEAEQARQAAVEQARRAAAEQARQAAAEQAHQAEAEQARLAAVHRHDEKLRAERQRQETARRAALVKQAKAANATSQQEQAVQDQLDSASAPARGGQDQPVDSRGRHEQNAKLLPQSLPSEGPPLDAGDLPPPAPSAPAEIH